MRRNRHRARRRHPTPVTPELRVLGRGTVMAPDTWTPVDDALTCEPAVLSTLTARTSMAPPIAHLAATTRRRPCASIDKEADELREALGAQAACKSVSRSEPFNFGDGTAGVTLVASLEPIPGFTATQRHVLRPAGDAIEHMIATLSPSAFTRLDEEVQAILASYAPLPAG